MEEDMRNIKIKTIMSDISLMVKKRLKELFIIVMEVFFIMETLKTISHLDLEDITSLIMNILKEISTKLVKDLVSIFLKMEKFGKDLLNLGNVMVKVDCLMEVHR